MKRSIRQEFLNGPNLITLFRIALIPGVCLAVSGGGPGDSFIAACLMALAAISDFFDGYLARKQQLVSVLGKFLDPLADKLIVMATLVMLVPMGRIEAWRAALGGCTSGRGAEASPGVENPSAGASQ
jgi:CDP-diacylglycerol--glycerol-3-phosphate 3-phosphatidyltransferase